MIAVSSSGKSFHALAAYLMKGRTGAEHDRVAWSTGRNLPTDDPELAATFMRATASRSDRVEKPVYHVVLSFDPSDAVDRVAMERVADRVLDRLGLREHQAVIVAHRDREHAHVHVFINRVHPETGKAWERWKDQPLIQEVLREQEAALGLRSVSGSLTTQRQPNAALDLFSEPERATSAPGLRDDSRERAEPRSRIEQLKRDLETFEVVSSLSREHFAARLAADAARARVSQIDEAFHRARTADESFDRALGKVYREPERAKQAFTSHVAGAGVNDAARTLREHPEHLGILNTVQSRHALAMVRREDDSAARAMAPEAARFAAVAIEAERAAWAAVSQAQVRRLDEEFARQLEALYERPAAVRRHFEARARIEGIESVARELAERPSDVGDLRGSISGDSDRLAATARAAAQACLEASRARQQATAETGRSWIRSIERTGTGREQDSPRDNADRAAARERGLREQLKRHPRASELRQRIVRATDLLLPHEVRRLKQALTAPLIALASTLRATAREILIGRDQDRQG